MVYLKGAFKCAGPDVDEVGSKTGLRQLETRYIPVLLKLGPAGMVLGLHYYGRTYGNIQDQVGQ